MANMLSMADQAAIIALWQRGWSQRRIARETGVDRETVARYVHLARSGPIPRHAGSGRFKPGHSDRRVGGGHRTAGRSRWSLKPGHFDRRVARAMRGPRAGGGACAMPIEGSSSRSSRPA